MFLKAFSLPTFFPVAMTILQLLKAIILAGRDSIFDSFLFLSCFYFVATRSRNLPTGITSLDTEESFFSPYLSFLFLFKVRSSWLTTLI